VSSRLDIRKGMAALHPRFLWLEAPVVDVFPFETALCCLLTIRLSGLIYHQKFREPLFYLSLACGQVTYVATDITPVAFSE